MTKQDGKAKEALNMRDMDAHAADCYHAFLNGDDNAFVEIIRAYQNGLLLYLNRFVSNLTAAEDLTEDTFVKLVTKKPRFSGRSSFKTWLYAIGRNTAVDHLRKTSREMPLPEDMTDEELSLERSYLQEERKRQLYAALRQLKPEYGQILWLVYFEDFSIAGAAKVMKKSLHATEMLATRARKALKEELTREGFTYEGL